MSTCEHNCPFKNQEKVRKDAYDAGFSAGLEVGANAMLGAVQMTLDARSEVVNVYRNGPHTIIETADGEKTRVTYDPGYGYPYDREKALMAAMLKAMVGNKYIAVLKRFAHDEDAECIEAAACDGAKQNVAKGMIRKIRKALRDAWSDEPDPFDVDEYADQIGGAFEPAHDEACDAPAAYEAADRGADDDLMMDGEFHLHRDDDGMMSNGDFHVPEHDADEESLLSDLSGMAPEPGYDPSLFA